jgi:hypothetical protein
MLPVNSFEIKVNDPVGEIRDKCFKGIEVFIIGPSYSLRGW